MKKKNLLVALLLVASMLLAACGGGAQPSESPGAGSQSTASGDTTSAPPPTSTPRTTMDIETLVPVETVKIADTMTYSLLNSSWDLSPFKQDGSSGDTLMPILYGCLLVSQAFGTPIEEMQNDLAKSVSFSSDRLTATIELYDYIRDSKGNTIKAEDIVFSYTMAPTLSVKYNHVSQLESVTATGEYTVEMKVGTVGAGVWENILGNCPIVSQSWYESSSDEEKANDPATTGAYRVISNVPGTSITLEAIEDFWQTEELRCDYRLQNVKTLYLVCIVEDGMRRIALETGEIDATRIQTFDVENFVGNPNFYIFPTIHSNVTTMLFNCAPGSLTSNVALRKAIMHAIDFDQVRIAGGGHPDYGILSNDTGHALAYDYDPAWNDEPYFEYDVDKALQYMDEAGYGPNSGLTLTFLVRNLPNHQAGAAVIQAFLAQIGLNIEVTNFDNALFNTTLREPDGWHFNWISATANTGSVLDAWSYLFGAWGGGTTIGHIQGDDRLQELLEDAIQIHDLASRNAFRNYVNENGYGRNIYIIGEAYVSQAGITNIPFNWQMNPTLNAFSYSDDYQSVVR